MHVHCTLPVHAHTPNGASSFRFGTSCFLGSSLYMEWEEISNATVSLLGTHVWPACQSQNNFLCWRLNAFRRSQQLGFCCKRCLKALFCWGNKWSQWPNLHNSLKSWKTLFSFSFRTSGIKFDEWSHVPTYRMNPCTTMFLITAQNSVVRAFELAFWNVECARAWVNPSFLSKCYFHANCV